MPHKYNDPAVLEQLEADFRGKCYLCEGKGDLEVEHFRPRVAFPEDDKKWNNLFPAHGARCNGRRLRWEKHPEYARKREDGTPMRWPEHGMLDCTDPETRVVERLQQWFTDDGGDLIVHFQAAAETDLQARNTAWELSYIHMHRHDGWPPSSGNGAKRAKALRADIKNQWDKLVAKLLQVQNAFIDGDASYRQLAAEFRAMLADDAPYAGLMRGTLQRSPLIAQRLRKELLGAK